MYQLSLCDNYYHWTIPLLTTFVSTDCLFSNLCNDVVMCLLRCMGVCAYMYVLCTTVYCVIINYYVLLVYRKWCVNRSYSL